MLLGFVFLFLTLQNLTMILELPPWINLVSDIQNERTSTVPNGIPGVKILLSYIIIYIAVLSIVYIFLLKRNATLTEAFVLGSLVYIIADTFMFAPFKRSHTRYIPTLLYDIFIVGGASWAACMYVYKFYPSILTEYTMYLGILFGLSFWGLAKGIHLEEQKPHVPRKVE